MDSNHERISKSIVNWRKISHCGARLGPHRESFTSEFWPYGRGPDCHVCIDRITHRYIKDYPANITWISITLVWVGPVISKSPVALK